MNQHNGNHKAYVEPVSKSAPDSEASGSDNSDKRDKSVARATEDVSSWADDCGAPSLPRDGGREGFQLLQWVERFLHDAPATLEEVRTRVEKEVRERPLMAVGIAAAVGFVVGGGFRSKSGRKMIKRAIQYGMSQAQNVNVKDGVLE